MNFVQQLEESLRDLAAESRKNHPGVKEASERATLKLRSLQNEYASAVRKAKSGGKHPTTALFQSSDILHPFLLAANYPTAGTKLRETTFRAMRLLMEADAVVPTDGINLIRVWMIQAQVAVSYYQKQYSKEAPVATSSSWFSSWSESKTAVSSSSGHSGQSHSSKEMEKLALDILSCLVQLLEQMRTCPEHLTYEVWTNAVALGCVWFHYLPLKHTVTQAARSTLSQIMSLLFELNVQVAESTWEDLLIIASNDDKKKLNGAFSLCLNSSTTNAQVSPPDSEFALELMSKVWKLFQSQTIPRTLQVTLQLIKQGDSMEVEKYLRVAQWTQVLLSTSMKSFPNECQEVLIAFLRQIVSATEVCRKHHDFEDGYVYTEADNTELENATTESTTVPVSLIPMQLLWRCGLTLEVIYNILEAAPAGCGQFLLDASLLQRLSEALSDFATVGASCKDHMHQLVAFSRAWRNQKSSPKPSLVRKMEQLVAAGSVGTAIGTDTKTSSSERRQSTQTANVVLGEALWLSFQSILLILEHIRGAPDELNAVDGCFSHSLALLQHWLKRFVGSPDLVRLALKGYENLANVFLPSMRMTMQRKALLTSLCKLSLPTWGKRDPSCKLHSHHVLCLLTLLRIVHIHRDSLDSEWDLVLTTLEELSVMSIASEHLSDQFYNNALAIAAVYLRLPAFSSSISNESFRQMLEALATICKDLMQNHDVITGRDTVLVDKISSSKSEGDEKSSISGKIMSVGVKAFYGASGSKNEGSNGQNFTRTRDTYSEDYRRNFTKRLSTSTVTIRVSGHLPFAMILLADVAMSNSFRFKECGDTLSSQLSILAAASPAARPFAMDIMAMMTTSHLSEGQIPALFIGPGKIVFEDPMQSQLLAVEKTETEKAVVLGDEAKDVSQSELLAPLCSSLQKSKEVDVAESSLQTVHSILEGSGHMMHGDVWILVISAISSVSGDPSYTVDRTGTTWAKCNQQAFKTLKLVVDDFSRQLHEEANHGKGIREALLECCASFGRSRHDLNISLTAMGLLWTIADQDSGTEAVTQALEKLEALTLDDRPEIRNAGINTFISCVMGRGTKFTSQDWEHCISDRYFKIYEKVLSNTKSGDTGKKSILNPSRYKVALHDSRDSSEKQWMATQVILLRGLERILKTFFGNLLSTAELDLQKKGSRQKDSAPWFQDVWVKILDYAYEAAGTSGGRSSLDLRLAGVELMVVAAQASTRTGIQAAIGPARVSTNMEVVNGALRTVRESISFSKDSSNAQRSEKLEKFRENLFLEAFESLEGHIERLEKTIDKTDDTVTQILHKFCTLLIGLYECCKRNEFDEDEEAKALQYFDSLMAGRVVKVTGGGMQDRFIGLVQRILVVAPSESTSRFLNQGQRACFDVFEKVASEGSFSMLLNLLEMAGAAVFCREVLDMRDDTEILEDDSNLGSELVRVEASTVLAKVIKSESISNVGRIVLSMIILKRFVDTKGRFPDHRKAYYKRLIPFIESGVLAVEHLLLTTGTHAEPFARALWGILLEAIRLMSKPMDMGDGLSKISRAPELKEIINLIESHVPNEQESALVALLDDITSNTLRVTDINDVYCIKHPDTDRGRKAKRHRDELVHLFSTCFETLCKLTPSHHDTLDNIATKVLQRMLDHAYRDEPDEYRDTIFHTGLSVCNALCHSKMESTVIAVFPLLCQLIVTDHPEIRSGVSKVLTEVNVKDAFVKDNSKYLALEQRALIAESKVERLSKQIESLRRTNRQLEEEVKVLRQTDR